MNRERVLDVIAETIAVILWLILLPFLAWRIASWLDKLIDSLNK